MLCDRDSVPWGSPAGSIETEAKGKLRLLSKYHLENYFLDENTLAKVFEQLEPDDSWLRSPSAIRREILQLALGYASYSVALAVSREFRLNAGSVDLMPKDCCNKTQAEIVEMLVGTSRIEKARIATSLNETQVAESAAKHFQEIAGYLTCDNPKWKDIIPGKPLLAAFASKAKIDQSRLKTAYLRCAETMPENPFTEIHSIFDSFAKG
jgi:hypothetical protein